MELVGRLVADATVRKTTTEKELTGFRVAVNRTYKADGERKEQTTFIDCAYWRGTKIAPYLTKGLLVQLSGFMTANAWVSRDGELMAGLNLQVGEIQFLTASGKGDTEQTQTHNRKRGRQN
jgi:single-strand DNA-binding protein